MTSETRVADSFRVSLIASTRSRHISANARPSLCSYGEGPLIRAYHRPPYAKRQGQQKVEGGHFDPFGRGYQAFGLSH
jgi:hypothetical protein